MHDPRITSTNLRRVSTRLHQRPTIPTYLHSRWVLPLLVLCTPNNSLADDVTVPTPLHQARIRQLDEEEGTDIKEQPRERG